MIWEEALVSLISPAAFWGHRCLKYSIALHHYLTIVISWTDHRIVVVSLVLHFILFHFLPKETRITVKGLSQISRKVVHLFLFVGQETVDTITVIGGRSPLWLCTKCCALQLSTVLSGCSSSTLWELDLSSTDFFGWGTDSSCSISFISRRSFGGDGRIIASSVSCLRFTLSWTASTTCSPHPLFRTRGTASAKAQTVLSFSRRRTADQLTRSFWPFSLTVWDLILLVNHPLLCVFTGTLKVIIFSRRKKEKTMFSWTSLSYYCKAQLYLNWTSTCGWRLISWKMFSARSRSVISLIRFLHWLFWFRGMYEIDISWRVFVKVWDVIVSHRPSSSAFRASHRL